MCRIVCGLKVCVTIAAPTPQHRHILLAQVLNVLQASSLWYVCNLFSAETAAFISFSLSLCILPVSLLTCKEGLAIQLFKSRHTIKNTTHAVVSCKHGMHDSHSPVTYVDSCLGDESRASSLPYNV